LPGGAAEGVAEAMSRLDPQADIRIEVVCPSCGHRSERLFDIGVFLWDEMQTWAVRTLREVHELAQAYGWREQDILAMSAARRSVYLALSKA
jgi:hypothetical protein